MPHIETSDLNFIKRYHKKSKQTYEGVKYCPVCGEQRYFTGRVYIHACKARLRSGKSISGRNLVKK